MFLDLGDKFFFRQVFLAWACKFFIVFRIRLGGERASMHRVPCPWLGAPNHFTSLCRPVLPISFKITSWWLDYPQPGISQTNFFRQQCTSLLEFSSCLQRGTNLFCRNNAGGASPKQVLLWLLTLPIHQSNNKTTSSFTSLRSHSTPLYLYFSQMKIRTHKENLNFLPVSPHIPWESSTCRNS